VIREDWLYSRPEKVKRRCNIQELLRTLLSVQLAGCRCRLLAWSPIRIALAEPTELRMSLWSQREQNHRKKRIKAASIGGPIIIPTRSVIGAIVSGQRRH